ncbi:hypothetical protein ACT6QG_11365 [Xanthobacter sp. TB0136]|uniref:hypothetical protein n=1 Tax=Xanthobacter sp. TB0136 TaxID=3459177 RepID=UPI00403911EA
MDDLIARLVARHKVNEETARALVLIVLQYLVREAPEDKLAPIIAAHPWIPEVLAGAGPEQEATPASHHFGGMARLMEVADRMMTHGLTMSEVQSTVRDTVDYARENAGDEAVDALVRAIPGLRQVV